MKLNINSKGQIVHKMNEVVYSLKINQRLWLNKVITQHRDWLDTLGEGAMGTVRIHQILNNDSYKDYDKDWLNTLREMYIESFVYGVGH